MLVHRLILLYRDSKLHGYGRIVRGRLVELYARPNTFGCAILRIEGAQAALYWTWVLTLGFPAYSVKHLNDLTRKRR